MGMDVHGVAPDSKCEHGLTESFHNFREEKDVEKWCPGPPGAQAEHRRIAHELTADEPCTVCMGTGKRRPPPEVGPGDRECNGCGGSGRVRPIETWYPFDTERVEAFAAFLEHCGGFTID